MLLLNILCAWVLFIAVLWLALEWKSRVLPFLRRYRDWEEVSLIALAASLFLVLLLSWLGAAGDPNTKGHWFFKGIHVLFEVFEGNSEEFRGYAVHFPHIYGILSCAVPALTVFTAVRLLWNYLPHHVPMRKKEWYIFSGLDANSVRMAKDLAREDNLCIFLRSRRDKADADLLTELGDIHFFLYPGDEARFLLWPWRRGKILRFFFLSENTDENFQRMQEFLITAEKKNRFKPRDNPMPDGQFQQELYLLSETESAPMLIGHLRERMKGHACFQNTELRLLDRFRATSYDLLRTRPLHEHVHESKLNVLVLGFGKIGREFFRTACSLGILPGCRTEFTLCDQQIGSKLDMFLSQCPELRDSVTIHPRKLNADTAALDQLVGAKDYHYILVALGDDERNIRVASRLKRFYRLRHWEFVAGHRTEDIQPQICVNIEDSIKHAYTEGLWDDDMPWGHALHVFGGLEQVFTQKVLMPQNVWKAARYIHRELNREKGSPSAPPEPPKPLDWNEYERRSSIACAVRAEYLSASHPSGASPEVLADIEHRRWMAYVRSEGLRYGNTDLVDAYYGKVKGGHVDILGKLTPCLTEDQDKLEQVWTHLSTGKHANDYKDKRSFRQRDEFIVRNAAIIAGIAKTGEIPDSDPTT